MRLIFLLLLLLCMFHVPIRHVEAATNDAVGDALTEVVNKVSEVSTVELKPEVDDGQAAEPTEEEMVAAIKEILRIGTERAVAK